MSVQRSTAQPPEHVISRRAARAIAAAAKAKFYQDRTWPRVLERNAPTKFAERSLDRLSAWLPQGQVDQKREDGLALLRALDEFVRQGGVQPAGDILLRIDGDVG